MRRTRCALTSMALLLAACADAPGPAAPAAQAPAYPPTAQVAVYEQLQADLGAPRSAADGGGSARLVLAEGDDGAVVCATRGRWELEYVAGELGVAEGGSVALLVPPFWGWSTPQVEAPDAPGFTTLTSDAQDAELESFTADKSLLLVRVARGRLQPGETLRFVYGAGDALAVTDTYADREARFYFKVDGDGDGVSALVADAPAVEVLPGPAARLAVTLPTVARPGEAFALTVAWLDALANAARAPAELGGGLRLVSEPPGLELPASVPFASGGVGHLRVEARAPQPGTYRVRATLADAPDLELDVLSNPVRVDADARPVYWGDLHGHSGLSDGTGAPEDWFAYARDVAALDVAVLTDHDHFGVEFLDAHPELWARIRDEVRRVNEPGRFVALLGYEWTNWLYGHRHVLYFSGEGEVHGSLAPDATTPAQLWARLVDQDAITIAHHSAGGPVAVDWSFAPDPLVEPVAEVMSVHGSSEAWDSPSRIYAPRRGNFVRDQLDRGMRFGFVGSGDGHDGHPGHTHLAPTAGYRRTPPDPRGLRSDERLGNGGLAAIRATELEPHAVLAALRARDVYATSGPRIWLAAALAGHRMGSDVPAGDVAAPASLVIAIAACAGLQHVELVRRGRPVERVPCAGELDLVFEIGLEGLAAGDYVYVRVLQRDGGLAWSSPFFVR